VRALPNSRDIFYYRAYRYALGKDRPSRWTLFDHLTEARLGWVRTSILMGRCPICREWFQGAIAVRRHLARSDCKLFLRALVEGVVEEYRHLKSMYIKEGYYKRKRHTLRLPDGSKVRFRTVGELVEWYLKHEGNSVF
jgi:hypothetical protein